MDPHPYYSSSMIAVMEEEVKFLQLPDGRQIAYREQGLNKETATRSLLVLHGLGSSRIAGMPGVSEALLKEMGGRMIVIDRPGYGRSTPNPSQTFKTAATDIAHIADILELGEKIWLLGYSTGGAYCWGAARYIPERVAGIAMWAPVGNYWWKEFSDTERKMAMAELSGRTRMMFLVMRMAPKWMIRSYVRLAVVRTAGQGWVDNCKKQFSPPDLRNGALDGFGLMYRDSIEAMKQNGAGMAEDLHLITGEWGFELSDVPRVYHGPFHIWQGGEDWCVAPSLQRLIKKIAPELVQLHELPGEGHLSSFCYNDKTHRDTLSALFGSMQDTHEASLADVTEALKTAPSTQATEADVAKADPLRRELGGVGGSSSEQQDSAVILDNAIKGAQG